MIHLGTSSWQFEGWAGVFYPEDLPKDRQLAYYSQQFCTVEVNTSFYGLPRPSTLVKWVETVPKGFTFCLKAPRAITHDKKLRNVESETQEYLDVLRSLGVAAAPGFLQFPPQFSRKQDGKTLALYLDWLAPRLHGLRLGIEVRSADLMTEAFAIFLAERGFCYVLVDRIDTQDLFDLWIELVTRNVAPSFSIIRWIGDDQNGPQGDRSLSTPRDLELEKWADRLTTLTQQGVDAYGYMHNPYEGHSPASIRRLQAILATRVELPGWPTNSQPGGLHQASLL